jgi:broad specificity phosphatase PhoE
MIGRWRFIRHGQSFANAEGWLAGHQDVGLTELGITQATAARAGLEPPDRVFCSDLRRARETVAALGRPDATFTPRLRERHLGAWEGMEKAALRADGTWATLLTWEQGPPEGETQAAVARRMLKFLADEDAAGVTWVVSHATAIRCAVGLLDGIPLHEIGEWTVGNAQILSRDVAPGTWAELLRTLG